MRTYLRNSILIIPWIPFLIWFNFRPQLSWTFDVLQVAAMFGGAMAISIALSRAFPPPRKEPMNHPAVVLVLLLAVSALLATTSASALIVPDEPTAPEPVCAESFHRGDQRMIVDCLGRLVRLQLRDGRTVHFVFSDTTMQPFAASVDGANYFRAPTLPPLVQPKFTYHDDFGGAGGYDGGGAGAPGGSIGGYGGGGYGGGYGSGGYDPYGSGGYYYDPYREVIEVVESAYRDAQSTTNYIIAAYAAHNPGVDPAVCDTMCDLMGQSGGLACIAAGIIHPPTGGVCGAYMLGIWSFCRFKCLYP